MTRIISSLSEVSAGYDVLFCDLWGCLHNGKTPFPAAVAALRAFRKGGGTVLLLTNAPRPKPSVIKQLSMIGVPADCYDEVVSSGDAAQYALITGAAGRRVHHIGPEKDRVFFTDLSDDLRPLATTEPPIYLVSLEESEGIVCTGLVDDLTETPADYTARLTFARSKGLKLLCANPDLVVHFGQQLVYCAGAIAQAYDRMGGESLYFGKPHPPVYALARRRLAALPAPPAPPASSSSATARRPTSRARRGRASIRSSSPAASRPISSGPNYRALTTSCCNAGSSKPASRRPMRLACCNNPPPYARNIIT